MTAGGEDDTVLAGIARALRPGGRLALSAFNAYFAVRYHDGRRRSTPTSACPTSAPRSATPTAGRSRSTCGPAATRRASCGCCSTGHGLDVERISSVEPGAYGDDAADDRVAEFLVARRRESSHSD